jgi:hypothetical protein
VLLDIRVPQLNADRVEVPLAGPVSDVAVGGGGRYLILLLSSQRQLAVFDVNQARVVKPLSLAEDRPQIAAGVDKLFVASAHAGHIERYDLATLAREAEADLPGPAQALCVGCASRGPLLASLTVKPGDVNPSRVLFLDPATLAPVRLRTDKPIPGVAPRLLRASADGQVFAFRNGVGGEPHTVSTVVLHGSDASVYTTGTPSSLVCPAPDGRYVYGGCGVYTNELDPVFPKPIPNSFPKAFIPAVHGNCFARLEYKGWEQYGGTLALFREGQEQPFAETGPVEGVTNEKVSYGDLRDKLAHDQRVVLIPGARLIVTIPESNDRLVLHRFDVEAAVRQPGGK